MITRPLALLLLFAFAWLLSVPCFAQDPPLDPGRMSIDGVAIGMSYGEVLARLGRPKAIGMEVGLTNFAYPARKDRSEERSVWFAAGKVVYCSGDTLEEDGEPLFLFGMLGAILEDRFGPAQSLSVFSRWWPASGVVLAGSNNVWPADVLKSPIGLRDPAYAIVWEDGVNGKRHSTSEPWTDDESWTWTAEDISLGMSGERASQLGAGLDIVYRGGFVQAVRRPQSAILVHTMGSQDSSLILEVGQAPELFASSAPLKAPKSGWWSPAPGGKVKLRKGRIEEIELTLDNEPLFKALEAAQ